MDSGNRTTVLNISQFRQEWFRGRWGSSMTAACKHVERYQQLQTGGGGTKKAFQLLPLSNHQRPWPEANNREIGSNLWVIFVGMKNGVWHWDTPNLWPDLGTWQTNNCLGLHSTLEISSNFLFLEELGANPLQVTPRQMCQDADKHIKILLLWHCLHETCALPSSVTHLLIKRKHLEKRNTKQV